MLHELIDELMFWLVALVLYTREDSQTGSPDPSLNVQVWATTGGEKAWWRWDDDDDNNDDDGTQNDED